MTALSDTQKAALRWANASRTLAGMRPLLDSEARFAATHTNAPKSWAPEAEWVRFFVSYGAELNAVEQPRLDDSGKQLKESAE